MPKIRFLTPEYGGQSCELPDGTITVGRNTKNMICIQDDSVSGQHCEILVYGTEVILRDLGSRNGTFVNGTRINPQSEVKNGQEIRIGRIQLQLLLDNPYDEDVSAITAMDAFRRIRPGAEEKQPEKPTFPVIFSPLSK